MDVGGSYIVDWVSLVAGVFGDLFSFYEPVKADSHKAFRAHAVPLPCRAAKGLECVFPI
jgi:hypothetical protein